MHNKSQPQVNGFTLTKYAVFAEGLTQRQKLVLIIISAHADSRGIAYPSLARIAKHACSSYKRDRIIKTIDELCAMGFLERIGFHGRNRKYRVIGNVPTVGTCRKEAHVPSAGARMCPHSGDTNIPNNISVRYHAPSEQCTTPESETNKGNDQSQNAGCGISIAPKIDNERRDSRNRHRYSPKRKRMTYRIDRLNQKISAYTSFGNRLTGSVAEGIANQVEEFKREKVQIQKRLEPMAEAE